MPLPDPEPIYTDAAAEIERLAEAAYQQTLALIDGGMAPGLAVKQAMDGFSGQYAGALAQAFDTMLKNGATAGSVLAMPVGDITLSKRLYAHTQQTANEVAAIVRSQAQGITQARDLALRLYDGYNPADGIIRPLEGRARADLPKALRSLTQDTMTRRELSALIERGQQQAGRIKSEALKAAYMQAFDKAAGDLEGRAMRRALWVAEREKTRYMANRIAQTELKRAHTDAWAAEIMDMDYVDVVQVKMNPRHPLPDICDLHARANLFNMGPGLYPKAKAPKPPFHPFCFCKLVTRPDLTAEKAREREGAVRELLASMPANEAARVLGSRERMEAVMNGGDWRKLPGVRLEVVGQNVAMILPTVPRSMLDGLVESASSKANGGFASMWVDPTSHDRHVQRRMRKGEVASASEYEQKTIETILDAKALKVVTPANIAMRHTGKIAMMNDSWVVLLSESGRIVTSYPRVEGYKGFEARHEEQGDQIDQYPIPATVRNRLTQLLR